MVAIPPSYRLSLEMIEILTQIEANLIYLSSINLPVLVKEKIKRTSILKSSLFSARIEGNTLTYEQIEKDVGEADEKKEVFNILEAVRFIENADFSLGITLQTILKIHALALAGLSAEAGYLRTEPSAIFNQAGQAVYLTPAPGKTAGLLKQLLKYSNSNKEKFPLIDAFISHLVFEKIHPFIDGNGRVGRLLVFVILMAKQKINSFFIPFEEYLDGHKPEYYYHLNRGLKNTNDYLIFMLQAFYEQTEKIKKLIAVELTTDQLLLTPRQEEIYNIIKDHKVVSFDEIKRRFLTVPSRTLSYDIKKLMNKKIVVKIGQTKGVYYKAN